MNFRRLARVALVSFLLAAAVTAVATPPDVFTRALSLGLLLLVFVPVGYVVDAVRTGDAGT